MVFPDPGPRERPGSGFGGFLWALTIVIFGGLLLIVLVALAIEHL